MHTWHVAELLVNYLTHTRVKWHNGMNNELRTACTHFKEVNNLRCASSLFGMLDAKYDKYDMQVDKNGRILTTIKTPISDTDRGCWPVEVWATSDTIVREMLSGLLTAKLLQRVGPQQITHRTKCWRLLESVQLNISQSTINPTSESNDWQATLLQSQITVFNNNHWSSLIMATAVNN